MFASNTSAANGANYIEDVFSTWLYTGTGATQTITNGVDLSTYGGMTWIKGRSGATNHNLFDTLQGATKLAHTNDNSATITVANSLTAFTTSGFTLGTGNTAGSQVNTSAATYGSWSFRKLSKFYTQGTYTGNGTSGRTIAHDLGSTPGFIVVKRTDGVSTGWGWLVYHRSLGATKYIEINGTSGAGTSSATWNNTEPTSSVFTVGSGTGNNVSGATYVYYMFAHNAGGFGLTGADNVISCGSFTTDSNALASVTLGYEPQWLLVKNSASSENWFLVDNMRNLNLNNTARLFPNTSGAESLTTATLPQFSPNATGFSCTSVGSLTADSSYIYVAIRRGPMKVPTLGTSVYNAISRTGTGANATISGVGFPPDLLIECNPSKLTANSTIVFDRLRGQTLSSYTNQTSSEDTTSDSLTSFASMDGVLVGADTLLNGINVSGTSYINWFFRRAPSYMDTVCYDGTGSNTTKSHNLGVVPELILIKSRDTATNWGVYSSAIANTEYLVLNSTAAKATGATYWNSTTPTASIFSLGTDVRVNNASTRYVAYLFATAAGVSKVGSYTGTATTLQIDCGFTGGARFVLIKRTNSLSDWYVWDSTRGIVAGNDPFLRLNSTQAETTNTDYVDTYSAGFEISSTATAAINVSGGTYIFLAIA